MNVAQQMAVDVRYNFLYISLPFPDKQQREMTKVCVNHAAKFFNFFIAILTVASSIVINVPTRRLLAVETKVLLFCGWQNLNIKRFVCKQ